MLFSFKFKVLAHSLELNDTALLVFSRTAKCESANKVLAKTKAANLAVTDFLCSNIEQLAIHTKLPYYIIDETQQKGESFGQKFSSAFKDLFLSGYKYIIAIGNDCPQLTSANIITAASVLHRNGAVVGPTNLNGAYLIGMSSEVYHEENFALLPWQSEKTLAGLEKYFEAFTQNNCILLQVKNEINNIDHWEKVLSKINISLRNLILTKLLSGKSIVLSLVEQSYEVSIYVAVSLLRGPPKRLQ